MAIAALEENLRALQNSRNVIRGRLAALGLAEEDAGLAALAAAVDGIADRGAMSAAVGPGEICTIPAGYHNGAGTVTGRAGTGSLEPARTVTPQKQPQHIVPAAGYDGLTAVVVEAIADRYQDVSAVTATAGTVLQGSVFVDSGGAAVEGTVPCSGDVSGSLDGVTVTELAIPAGYTDGGAVVFDDTLLGQLLDAI